MAAAPSTSKEDFTLELATQVGIAIREKHLKRPLTTIEKDQVREEMKLSIKATSQPKPRPANYTSTVKTKLLQHVGDKPASIHRDKLLWYIRDGEWDNEPFPRSALYSKLTKAGYKDLATKCEDGEYDTSDDELELPSPVLASRTGTGASTAAAAGAAGASKTANSDQKTVQH